MFIFDQCNGTLWLWYFVCVLKPHKLEFKFHCQACSSVYRRETLWPVEHMQRQTKHLLLPPGQWHDARWKKLHHLLLLLLLLFNFAAHGADASVPSGFWEFTCSLREIQVTYAWSQWPFASSNLYQMFWRLVRTRPSLEIGIPAMNGGGGVRTFLHQHHAPSPNSRVVSTSPERPATAVDKFVLSSPPLNVYIDKTLPTLSLSLSLSPDSTSIYVEKGRRGEKEGGGRKGNVKSRHWEVWGGGESLKTNRQNLECIF